MAADSTKASIVFVHGAFCDGSVWTKTLMPLAHEGFRIHTAQLPLESFPGDVAALTNLLDHVDGPTLLVAHSYGGSVASAAGTHAKVKALAFISALVPAPGQVIGTISSMYPAKEQTWSPPDARGFLWLTSEFTAAALGHDLHRGGINLFVATQKPTSISLFEHTVNDPAWQHKPSAYLVTTEDRILAPETQHALASRINARVEEVAASHLVMLSQPEAVANFVRTSALALQP